jgi:hypothetical protein
MRKFLLFIFFPILLILALLTAFTLTSRDCNLFGSSSVICAPGWVVIVAVSSVYGSISNALEDRTRDANDRQLRRKIEAGDLVTAENCVSRENSCYFSGSFEMMGLIQLAAQKVVSAYDGKTGLTLEQQSLLVKAHRDLAEHAEREAPEEQRTHLKEIMRLTEVPELWEPPDLKLQRILDETVADLIVLDQETRAIAAADPYLPLVCDFSEYEKEINLAKSGRSLNERVETLRLHYSTISNVGFAALLAIYPEPLCKKADESWKVKIGMFVNKRIEANDLSEQERCLFKCDVLTNTDYYDAIGMHRLWDGVALRPLAAIHVIAAYGAETTPEPRQIALLIVAHWVLAETPYYVSVRPYSLGERSEHLKEIARLAQTQSLWDYLDKKAATDPLPVGRGFISRIVGNATSEIVIPGDRAKGDSANAAYMKCQEFAKEFIALGAKEVSDHLCERAHKIREDILNNREPSLL